MKTSAIKIACLTMVCPATAYAAGGRPNIIFIFTDQQTASAMSCAGNPDIRTPNMDRLAEAGVRFTNAYCASPLSGPSRAAMFTGLYPAGIGMSVNGAAMPDSLEGRTLGTLVSAAGYDCVYGGKWHLPDIDIPDGRYGFRRICVHDDLSLADSCVAFLEGRHDRPFFLVASFIKPHNICEFARNQDLPYGNVEVPEARLLPQLPANFAVNPYDADVVKNEKEKNFSLYPTSDYTPDDWRAYRYAYFRLVEKVDAEIGEILGCMDREGLWKNTVVIFSSDHGDGAGAHKWNQKSALYEEVVNVPLTVVLPGGKNAGKVLPQLVCNGPDFFASVCDLAGAGVPDWVEGKSFRALAEKGRADEPFRDLLFVETQFDRGTTKGWAVIGKGYKYILYDKGRFREQLYDLSADRGEMRNLAVEARYEGTCREFRDALEAWLSRRQPRR